MRYKSEETMDRIVKSIERFFFAHHRSPSITEIASDVGCSRSTIHSYLREMNQLGRLQYDGKSTGNRLLHERQMRNLYCLPYWVL